MSNGHPPHAAEPGIANPAPAGPSDVGPAYPLAAMPFAVALGITVELATAEKVIAHLPRQAGHRTAGGLLNGGALITLADTDPAPTGWPTLRQAVHRVDDRSAQRGSRERDRGSSRAGASRSTRVAITERQFDPRIRSPSQWPATARSATSVGRSLIMIMSGIFPEPPLLMGRLGRLTARPVRKCWCRSARRCPRPWT